MANIAFRMWMNEESALGAVANLRQCFRFRQCWLPLSARDKFINGIIDTCIVKFMCGAACIHPTADFVCVQFTLELVQKYPSVCPKFACIYCTESTARHRQEHVLYILDCIPHTWDTSSPLSDLYVIPLFKLKRIFEICSFSIKYRTSYARTHTTINSIDDWSSLIWAIFTGSIRNLRGRAFQILLRYVHTTHGIWLNTGERSANIRSGTFVERSLIVCFQLFL